MKLSSTKKLVLSAFFLALGVLLPLLVGHLVPMGWIFLPMHVPVLLCGFFCGGPWGLAVGFVTPLLSGAITGMPGLFPDAVVMAFELGAYGLLSGLFYRLFPKNIGFTYVSLLLAMIGGRIVWAAASFIILGIAGTAFTFENVLSGAVVMVLPGIIIQIVLIPILVVALDRTKKTEQSVQA